MLVQKVNASIWFPGMKKRLKIKGNARCRGQVLIQKARATGEFVIVAKNGVVLKNLGEKVVKSKVAPKKWLQ